MPDLPSDAEISCLERVYDDYEGELEGQVDCYIDASQEFDSCIRAADCDLGGLDGCNNVAEARFEACPGTTVAAGEAFNACTVK